ncbi:MAG: biotin--[acetyl-CoA-carboxylase] ligase [Gemmatimonadetes bacterium]|nr:biotin--[acetyl-CoA-carboxylase] ligase [Gemmatimonadota bacterium]MYB61414.1 biotin--[acetyl-CoA-carboxylase] ligase [Gemmatimonadota bacterium]
MHRNGTTMKPPCPSDELEGFQDRYDAVRMRAKLSSRIFGRVLEYHARVGSTNDVILDMAEQAAPHGTVCLADEQSAGRGRRGYGWFSPPGCGIWASVLLRPRLSADRTPPLTLCAAAAVAPVLETAAGVSVEIKWPNDLLMEGRKVAGILAESRVVSGDEPVIVIGMGINVNHTRGQFPDELSASATSLRIESGRPVGREDLFLAILASLESAYGHYLASGPASLLAEVDARLAWQGLTVEADSPAGSAGRVSHIDEEGGLVLDRQDGGPLVIRSGSIRLLRLRT